MKIIVFILLVMCFTACTDTDPSTNVKEVGLDTAVADTMVYGDMKKYWLVLLQKGPNRNQDSIAAAEIQERHLANIDRLAKEGVIIMAGPMGDNTDLRGIFIMDSKDSLEAVSHIKSDTAIITGRLKFEIHPWWTAKGRYNFK